MMAKSYIIALDIGSFFTKGILFEEEDGMFFPLKHEIIYTDGIIKGEIQDVQTVRRTLITIIEKLKDVGSRKIKTYEIIVGYSTNCLNIDTDSLTVEPPEKKEIKETDLTKIKKTIIKKYQDDGKQILDSNFMKFIVDDKNVRNPISFYAQKSLSAALNIVWVDENAFSLLINVFKNLLTDSLSIYDSTLSSAYAVTSPNDRDIGVTYIDFGYHMCRTIIFKNGIPKMYFPFPYGMKYILKDISNILKCSEEEAHRLLREDAVCLRDTKTIKKIDYELLSGTGKSYISQNLLNKIVFARIREILSRLNGELSKIGYENTLEVGALQSGIIFSGGGSYIKNIDNTINDLMGENHRKGILIEHSRIKIPEDMKNNHEFIPVYGILQRYILENTERDFEENNDYEDKNISSRVPQKERKQKKEKKNIFSKLFEKISGGEDDAI